MPPPRHWLMRRSPIFACHLFLLLLCISPSEPSQHHHQHCYCRPGRSVYEGCGFLRNYSMLVNQPAYAPGQAVPCLLLHHWLGAVDSSITFSIILSVHNQEEAIREHLLAILELTTETWELIVVLDYCRDGSESIVIQLLNQMIVSCGRVSSQVPAHCISSTLTRIVVIKQDTSVFETTTNNIGMRASLGQFYVLVQDDMLVRERGWNTLLSQPARLWTDVLAVSARCAEGGVYSDLGKWSWLWSKQRQVGSACPSTEIDEGSDRILQQCMFRIRDTVNRGPLLLDAKRAIALGYFDELNFYHGDDDHDLCTRAWMQHRWKCGVLDIDFIAPLRLGASRKISKSNMSQVTEFIAYRDSRRMFRPTLSQRFNPKLLDPEFNQEGRPSHDEDRRLPGRCKRRGWFTG